MLKKVPQKLIFVEKIMYVFVSHHKKMFKIQIKRMASLEITK